MFSILFLLPYIGSYKLKLITVSIPSYAINKVDNIFIYKLFNPKTSLPSTYIKTVLVIK